MKPNCTIIQGDCLDVLCKIPNQSIDMIFCDLPYGTTSCNWDTIIPLDKLWQHYMRIIKPGRAIILTASQPFTSRLVASNLEWFKCEWIWQKNRGSNFASTKYQPMKEHESVLVFGQGKVDYYPIQEPRAAGGLSRVKYPINASNTGKREAYGNMKAINKDVGELRCPRSIQKFNTEVGLHPTQKPVTLVEYFIKTYSQEGDLILDNCAGSGTTGVAALKSLRRCLLVENQREYCEIIKKRIVDFTGTPLELSDPNVFHEGDGK